jgi:hypothetical protein
MKKIILLLFLSSLQISFGQCVDLTVKEHFAGDPIFRLESGDIVQICEDSKIISFGGTTLYILKATSVSASTFIYEFKMDDVYYSPKYGEIQINSNTQKFGISLISGNYGAWTYFTEAEMAPKEAVIQTPTPISKPKPTPKPTPKPSPKAKPKTTSKGKL